MKNKIKITLIGIGIGILLALISGCIEENQNNICKTDHDCVLGVNINNCCDCPSPYSKKQVDSNPTLMEYESGRDYSSFIIPDCSNVICSPCGLISTICHNGTCIRAPPPFNVSERKIEFPSEDNLPPPKTPDNSIEFTPPRPYSANELIEIAGKDSKIHKIIEEKDYIVMDTRGYVNEKENLADLIIWAEEKYYTITINLKNETVKSVEEQKSRPLQLSTDQYCSVKYGDHSRESCDSDRECVFCPNSKTSNSLDCHSVEFCNELGFVEEWYDGIPGIMINHSISNASVKQNIKLWGQIIISNNGTGQLNVKISAPEFIHLRENSFSIPGKIPGRNASELFVMVDVDTTQPREIIGDIIIKSNDPNRSEVKIPINFIIISYTPEEAKAVSIANATQEVQEFRKQYLPSDYRSGYYPDYFSNDVNYEVKASAQEVLVVEYYISNYGPASNYTIIKITINSSSWEVIEKYPKIEYIKNSNYCESDDDCRIHGQFPKGEEPCSCCRGCANFVYLLNLNMKSLAYSWCWPVYDCECINKTCTAITNEYYTNTALSKKDPSVCENIIFGGRDSCFKIVAIEVQDALICDKINISSLKYECLAVIKKDDLICENILSNKDDCYSEVAVAKEDPTICDKIISESSSVKAQCFKKIAILKKDADLCEKIRTRDSYDNYHKISCLAEVKQDASICNMLPSGEWMKRDCIEEAHQHDTKLKIN